MAEIIRLGGQAKCLTAEVGGVEHDIPLADYMPMDAARELLRIKRMSAAERETAYTEFFLGYFERFIGEEAFATMNMRDFEDLMEAWNAASDGEGSATPGE